jgi:type II restriction/modification system DNA methylase subunit YeeA
MNTAPLKTYAPLARKAFIAAVGRRAELLGLNPEHPATVQQQGDVLLINGQPHPARIAEQRRKLAARIQQQGYASVIEALAYTWFNRLVAIRYMELHGYLDHGYRVLSHPDGGNQPEILEHLARIELPGLDRQQALEWKAAGNRDEDLYRAVLLAQCHALHTAMPFLFEAIDDATELLLPDGLLRTDSLIRSLVTAIEEASWQDVEIIGWLYQFYISEKKDQVMGKVVKSEDIPAATQLFTPNWIVKYMVQNSLGAQWLATYPDSGLKAQMAYYIEPAEQTDEVKAQLAAITPASLAPEALTLIDPACGSGHILVEAYELFKAIYLERGYVLRDIPKLVLEKNLYGMDIDERAAQLTGFALMMKARADDRRLFERGVQLNVMALQDSTGFDAERLAQGVKLADYDLRPGDLAALKALFEHATTFGSLIQVPEGLAAKLPALWHLSGIEVQDLFVREALLQLAVLVRQAEMLAARYDAVVANPPYMGSRGMNADLKVWTKANFPASRADMFAMFIERGFALCKPTGLNSLVTMQSWMFLSSFEALRTQILLCRTIGSMAHLGARAFSEISGEVVQTTAFVCKPHHLENFRPVFFRLVNGSEPEKASALRTNEYRFDAVTQNDLQKIPGFPIAYWVPSAVRDAFSLFPSFQSKGSPKVGMQTSNNDKYLRRWWEISYDDFIVDRDDPNPSWIVYLKGGSFRKWYGNLEFLLHYKKDPNYILSQKNATLISQERINAPKCTWTDLTSGPFSCRISPDKAAHDISGHCFYPERSDQFFLLGLSNSSSFDYLLKLINASFHAQVGDVARIPVPQRHKSEISSLAEGLVRTFKTDWDAQETSWDFSKIRVINGNVDHRIDFSSKLTLEKLNIARDKASAEETAINELAADSYGFSSIISTKIENSDLSLRLIGESEIGLEILSYAIGCMMGRYSLDAPGLIYAHSGNEGFDSSRYTRFPADADGILPLTDTEWFEDDACKRLVEFISVAWNAGHLEENLRFLADNLSPKKGEASRDTLRRYLCDRFFKDHLQTYKKRPIYWLFSSGKEKAFQCLVYLHRYNAGTLSRMRMDYVVPLQSRLQARIDQLDQDITASTSSATTTRLRKQQDSLRKQLEELRRFDEKLRHAADQRISLDLDDGVKVNYGKFGDLLAEVKAVTGGDSDD